MKQPDTSQLSESLAALVEEEWRKWGGDIDVGLLPAVSEDAVFWQNLSRVLVGSNYALKSFSRTSQLLSELYISGDLVRSYGESELLGRLGDMLTEVNDETGLMQQLRIFRCREMVRIIWRDLLRLAPMTETVADLSALADATLSCALDQLYGWLSGLWGLPFANNARPEADAPEQLVVIGMGKLGANELNLSSDVDLIFAYPRAGNLVGGSEEAKKERTNQEFFTRLAQQLIKVIDATTVDGFVFRVDMRLRPYGQSGALVLSFDALEEYYQDQGRDWERFAMIKARIVAGDKVAGQQLLESLRPFVYRRYVDFSGIESLRKMKALINREVARKGKKDDVKLGAGGIREVEFIAQAFQLMRGGRERSLQERGLIRVLFTLRDLEYLGADTVHSLEQAYIFLRNTEHALQAMDDAQTQLLPRGELERLRIAFSMGFDNWEGFAGVLASHRANVRACFEDVVAIEGQGQQQGARDSGWLALWNEELKPEESIVFLVQQGIDNPESALRRLVSFKQSRQVATMQREGRERLDLFIPLMLEEACKAEKPAVVVERAAPLVEAVLRRSAYLLLLVENPQALQQWLSLCAASPWIAQQLARSPALLDELLNVGTLYTPPGPDQLQDELHQQLLRVAEDDLEEQMEGLRYFKQAHVLRVAASEITEVLPLMKVSDYLSFISEATLEQVLEIAWHDMTERYGVPQKSPGVPCDPDFIIVGYGKLGGIELGYGSDLDLVFVHDAAINLTTDGERALDNPVFYARLGQRIIHMLSTTTVSGQLYEVDMRLRPSGASGLLVSSLKALRSYQMEKAWVWEHQALVRARVVAGSESLRHDFEQMRAEVLGLARDRSVLRKDVLDMRQKMRSSLASQGSDNVEIGKSREFDLKHDKGGIVDIEFMVQYGVLAWGQQYQDLLTFTDNVRILEALQHNQLLSADDAQMLTSAYITYRSAAHKLALQNSPGRVAGDEFVEKRLAVVKIWQDWLEGAV